MQSSWVLTFTSPDRPGIVEALTKVVAEHGGNWEESRMARLAGDFAGLARITVDEERASDLIAALRRLESQGLVVNARPTTTLSGGAQAETPDAACWQLVLAGADHEGIVNRVTEHLKGWGINVEEMETHVEPAPITGTPLFSMHCQIRLPHNQRETNALLTELVALENELSVEIDVQVPSGTDNPVD